MSGSLANTAIYVTDTAKQVRNYRSSVTDNNIRQIKTKINKHAFSGGQETMELQVQTYIITLMGNATQRQLGANLEVDVAYEYLTFFMESDERLAEIARDYSSGAMLTGEVKKELIEIVTAMVTEHTARREAATMDVVKEFMRVRELEFQRRTNAQHVGFRTTYVIVTFCFIFHSFVLLVC